MEKKKFLDGVKSAWKEAAQEAGKATHQYIENEHILMSICRNKCNALKDVSNKFRINLANLHSLMREGLHKLFERGHNHPDGVVSRSPACKKVFARAEELAGPAKETSCLHLLTAMSEEPSDTISEALNHVEPAQLQEYTLSYPTCTNQKCRPTFLPTLYAGVQKATGYIRVYGQDITQTRLGKFEIILGVVCLLFFISFFVAGFLLPEHITHEIPHRLHTAAVCTFILLFTVAEGYYVISELRNKNISKVVTHVLINMFFFSAIIIGQHIAYERFIAPELTTDKPHSEQVRIDAI